MNERIDKIRIEAAEWMKMQGYPLEYRSTWEKQCDEKFAELIVRECADIAYKTSWDDLVHGYGQAVIPLHLHNTIKQHFGVEG